MSGREPSRAALGVLKSSGPFGFDGTGARFSHIQQLEIKQATLLLQTIVDARRRVSSKGPYWAMGKEASDLHSPGAHV